MNAVRRESSHLFLVALILCTQLRAPVVTGQVPEPSEVLPGPLAQPDGRFSTAPQVPASRQFIVRPPLLRKGNDGTVQLEPNIEVSTPHGEWLPAGEAIGEPLRWDDRTLYLPEPNGGTGSGVFMPGDGSLPEPIIAEPVFGDLIEECHHGLTFRDILHAPIRTIDNTEGGGIGRERLVHAPFEITTTQPMNNFRLRTDLAYDLQSPNRAEFFWAAPPRGPALPESSIDYQDLRFLMEIGGEKFSTATELPLRLTNPERNPNHAGFADMSVTAKTVLLDGREWQISQLFRTHINTGAPSLGVGTGHLSLEPGVLLRHKLNDYNYLHGEITYWFPIGGTPNHSGQVLRDAIGISHLAYDSDSMAVITTLELIHWTVQNGQRTVPLGPPVHVDGEGILNILSGVRCVWDNGGDLGLVEFGVSGGASVTGHHWYGELLRIDLRFSY